MKLSMQVLLLGMVAILIGCAGEKNEVSADNTILAVRTFEDEAGLGAEEQTEFALLSGDIKTPEDAQLAAETATWVPASSLDFDDELDFVAMDDEDGVDFSNGRRDRDNRQTRRRRNRNNNRGRNYTPVRHDHYHYWENYRGFSRPNNRRFRRLSRCGWGFNYRGSCHRPYSWAHDYGWRWRGGYTFRWNSRWSNRYRSNRRYRRVRSNSEVYLGFYF
ncbi:MAG: hypothetical protein AAF203_05540 [Pseudomonadota bacterium]